MGAQRTKPKKNLLAQTKAGAKMRIMQCRIKYFAQLAAAAFWLLAASVPYAAGGQSELSIPSEGNSYVTKIDGEKKTASLWFKAEKPGTLELALKVKCENPSQEIRAAVAGRRGKKIMPDSAVEKTYPIGKIKIKSPEYVRVDLTGIEAGFEIVAKGKKEVIGSLKFVRDFPAYWGMRGPSVHMGYPLPGADVEYFYNEVFVPAGSDAVGSYFMCNGFAQGYCGIQVNSESERRILFSVWSPFETDNPGDIPEDKRVRLLKKGEGVHVGEFGNEGSGGQSFLLYDWKPDTVYRFVTRVRPDGEGNTAYTAWFFDPEKNSWRLIASFKRPETDTWYEGAHSFLENFIPEQGWITRKVYYQNQHARTSDGKWVELTEGTFSNDATAAAGVRQDYAGGAENGRFFLKNCGFFNENTPAGSRFERESGKEGFDFDVSALKD